jgi:hypothetical protein
MERTGGYLLSHFVAFLSDFLFLGFAFSGWCALMA